MCGICGIVSPDPARYSAERVARMRAPLLHRGPDGGGTCVEQGASLGHQRLAILDLSERGAQPMQSASGRFVIVYNGEIYNYRDLREELRAAGCTFRSNSDTEVLVEGIEAWGIEKLLARLDGIFAFGVWDREERTLLAARDHVGVKPFFYAADSEEFVFASEMRSLWAAGVSRTFDSATLEELLVFRFVAGDRTPFSGIRRLLPGHWLRLRDGRVETRAYWQATDHVGHEPAAATLWRERFQKAVSDQRISDVPLGTLLSGGLDSSAVTAELARVEGADVQTFTISVPANEGLDEAPYAAAVARRWKCRGHTLQIPAGDILARLRESQSFHDEPFAFGNDIHIFAISRLAKQHVTVLLSGEGADETLGGYTRYEPVRHPRLLRFAASSLGAPLQLLLGLPRRSQRSRLLKRLLSAGGVEGVILYNSARLMPQDLQQIGFPARGGFEVRKAVLERACAASPVPIRQLMLYEIETFLCSILDRNDRMTMASSIECRVPFLAAGVVEASLKLPTNALFEGRTGKKVLREHARDLLPPEVLNRAKWGLGIPWNHYLRNDPACRGFLENLAHTEFARTLGAQGLESAIRDYLAGDDRRASLAYQLFTLAVWWEQIVDGTAVTQAPASIARGV